MTDSSSPYRRPAEGKHVLLLLNLRLPRGAPWGGLGHKEGVGDFSLGYFLFFHLVVGGQQNMFSSFSRGNRNFLIDYLLPEIHLPSPVIILDWVSGVIEPQNKYPSFY